MRPVASVEPSDVDHTLEILRKQRVRYETVERPAQAGDRALVDFTGRIDAVEFPGGQAKNFAIILGEGRMLPGFEAALTGMKAGEHKSFELTFPPDYHGKEVAGKTARFDLSVQGSHTAQIMAKLYRHNGEWKMHAIGENASGRTFDDLMPAITPHL